MLCSTGFQHEGQWLRFRDTTPASPFGQDTGETFAKTAAGKKISSCKGGRDSHRALTALNPALSLEWLGGKVKAPLHTCPGELRELQVGCYLLRICKAEEPFQCHLEALAPGYRQAEQLPEHISFKKINKQHRVHISFQPAGRSRASGQEKQLPKVFLARDFCTPHSHFAPAVLEENPAAMQAEEIVKAGTQVCQRM